jgi:hypothetical protein
MKHSVQIEVVDDPNHSVSGIKVNTPGPRDRISAHAGDTVEWTINNRSRRALDLEIANVGAPLKRTGEQRDYPFTAQSLRSRAAAGDGTQAITAQLKAQINHFGRGGTTYKYDIVDHASGAAVVICDPEIEIPK